MRIGLFIPTNNKDYNSVSASIWIRVLQMTKYYRSFGARVYINNPFLIYDVSIVYRLPSKYFYWLVKLLKKTSGKVYFDTVVNYFVKHRNSNDQQVFYQRKIAEICSGIICSTEKIALYASRYNDAVFVMDDPIEVHRFTPSYIPYNKKDTVFGWSGTSAKAVALNKWDCLINERIVLLTDSGVKNINLLFEYDYLKWNYNTFSNDLRKCNVAFLPRSWKRDPYNSCHSSFKALVFAVLGIPIVANDIPSYRKLSKYYNAILFLEDYNGDLDSCLTALDGWNPIGKLDYVREYYSCSNQAKRLLKYLTA